MKIETKIITNANELNKMKNDLELFLSKHSKNPFILYPFIETYMQSYCQEFTPIILVTIVNKKIVGFAPLQLKRNRIFQTINFLFPYFVSPDFVIADEYRELVLGIFLHIIIKKIKCESIVLDLPGESQNLPILEKISKDCKLTLEKNFTDSMSQCKISLQDSFTEFEKAQGGQFKRKFRRILRNLDESGEWKITINENLQNDQDIQEAFNKIMAIEKMSWKANWRLETGCTLDKDLLWIWNASLWANKNNPDFKCKIWFLELNNQTIAYHLVIEYDGTAFITKTSFAEKYRNLSPGIFVHQAIITEQINRQETKTIDFLTNLPFMKTWNVKCYPRVTFTLIKSSFSNLLVRKAIELAYEIGHTMKVGRK
ncbi:MAG: GNAT family N-acetyltransferase [Parachlamydiaceae bacterium]